MFDVSSHFSNGAVVDVIDDTEHLGTFTVASGNVDVSAVKSSENKHKQVTSFYQMLKTTPIDSLQVSVAPWTGRPRQSDSTLY